MTCPVVSSAGATFEVDNGVNIKLWLVHSSKSLDTGNEATAHYFLPWFCPSSASSQAQVSNVVVYVFKGTAMGMFCEL